MEKRYWSLSFLAAGFLILGFISTYTQYFSWFGLVPLFTILLSPKSSTRDVILSSLFAGLLYYGAFFSWLIYYSWLTYVPLVLVLTPSLLIYFVPLKILFRKIASSGVQIVLCVFWYFSLCTAFSFTPLGAIPYELPFYGSLSLQQLSSIGNSAILPSLFVLLNLCIAQCIKNKNFTSIIRIFLTLLLFIGIFFWGQKELQTTYKKNISVALVQHNLPVGKEWRLQNENKIKETYTQLALEAAQKNPAIIIFPLYTFPEDIYKNPEFFTQLAQQTGSYILLGSHIPSGKKFFDGALLYSPEGKLSGTYQAVQAPPFRSLNETTETQYQLLETPFGKIGVLLCYEDSQSRIAQNALETGADFILALSNPGHFKDTLLPQKHLYQDQLRAIETGRFVIRVSPNGPTAIINPKGKLKSQTFANQKTIIYGQIGKGRVRS